MPAPVGPAVVAVMDLSDSSPSTIRDLDFTTKQDRARTGRPAWPPSPQSPVTRMHWAVTCAGPARRPGVRSDPDRVTLMIHDSERVGEATDKEITSHTKMYLANRPSAREQTHIISQRRCEGVPDRGWVTPDGGKGLRCQQGRSFSETADGRLGLSAVSQARLGRRILYVGSSLPL